MDQGWALFMYMRYVPINSMTPPTLTPRQAEIYAYLVTFHAEEDRLPSSREIQSDFGFASQTGALCHLRALANHGLIEHRGGDGINSRQWWRFARKETEL